MPREKLRTIMTVVSFIMLLLLFFTLPNKAEAISTVVQTLQ